MFGDDKRGRLAVELVWYEPAGKDVMTPANRVTLNTDFSFDTSKAELVDDELVAAFLAIQGTLQRGVGNAIKQLKSKISSRRLPDSGAKAPLPGVQST